MDIKPQFTLWSHGLNPWKVDIILRELKLTFETRFVSTPTNKPAEFLKDFPNGRFPALIDHDNEEFKTWESNAIVEYLIENYGKNSSIDIDHNNLIERQKVREWLSFQVSGQGIAFQDAAYWKFQANNTAPIALKRSLVEIERIVKVVDDFLKDQKCQWLLGEKLTYIDLLWFWWDEMAITTIAPEIQYENKFPHFFEWHERLRKIPSVRASKANRDRSL